MLTNSIGVFFPIEGFYLKGYYPTKLGEFLSSGIPVFTNTINKESLAEIFQELEFETLHKQIIGNDKKIDIELLCRIDTNKEPEYFNSGGILNYVLNSIEKDKI